MPACLTVCGTSTIFVHLYIKYVFCGPAFALCTASIFELAAIFITHHQFAYSLSQLCDCLLWTFRMFCWFGFVLFCALREFILFVPLFAIRFHVLSIQHHPAVRFIISSFVSFLDFSLFLVCICERACICSNGLTFLSFCKKKFIKPNMILFEG